LTAPGGKLRQNAATVVVDERIEAGLSKRLDGSDATKRRAQAFHDGSKAAI
jgi:hypothetical protein